ncbi:glycosyltransferase [Kineosporia sp. NBRC 101731]|uniref:glycosyltransferase family 2 protein n=1 Tax=Kineosporia sp. NBRC 101731 TaxID=3032199 RepID=UPI0024A39AB6|nr:glycosyltransferase [Kineosporia sp. NBRC 101731]GLY28615.1 glycosyl transferase [Kineosporia sp. NBRC 101731]
MTEPNPSGRQKAVKPLPVAHYGVVLLSQGTRPEALNRAVESVLAQRGVVTDVVVVGNGWEPTGLPEGARGVGLPENLGIPAGRNAGVPYVKGELLFFLDDDAFLPSTDILAVIAQKFADEPSLGLIQPRVADPDGLPSPRRWTPRLRVGDPYRSSDVTAVWEGGVALRRDIFAVADGWPAPFWYAHEGIELAWRVWDAGYRVRYDGDLVVNHPVIAPTRHAVFHRFSARNRVWLARRNLPLPVGLIYVGTWFAISAIRLRAKDDALEMMRGYWQGLTQACGPRRQMKWKAIWAMTKAGRPPII